jgi:DNA-binding PadR family transcriptional regulator
MSPVFRHGRLRLYLLKLLDESPRHGYEVIRLLQDRFMGVYSPSPGTIYPRLARLEEEGLVTHDESEGRKVYRITEKGREELRNRSDELTELEDELTASVRDIAREVTEDVRETVRSLREELTWAARDIHGGNQAPPRGRGSRRGRATTGTTSDDAGVWAKAAGDNAREQARAARDHARQAAADAREGARQARDNARRGRGRRDSTPGDEHGEHGEHGERGERGDRAPTHAGVRASALARRSIGGITLRTRRWGRTVGRVIENVVPTPGVLSTSIVPRCASTIVLAIASPNPVPSESPAT